MPPARPRARRRQLSSTPGPSSSSPTSTRTSSTAGSSSPTLSSSSASSSSPVSSSTSTLYTTSAVSSSSATPTPTPTPTPTRSRPALTQVISSALQNAVTRKPELNPSHLPIPPLANAPTLSLPLTLTRPATRPNPPKPTQHVSTKTGLGAAPPVHLQPPRPTETEDSPESSTTTSSRGSSSSSSSSSSSANNLLPPPTSHIAPGQPDPSPPAPTVSTGSLAPAPTADDTETGSFQEPTGQAVTAPSSTKHAATTIAVPVAVSALVVLAVLGALLLLRRRRRRRQPHHPYMQQVPPMTPANDSFGTVTTRSTGLGGERMMPNPFADAESLDERSQSPAASLYHDEEYASPFSDSYAAAAHHAAALEASRFAAPRLSSTPRSEAPRFVFSASDSDASVVGDAGHSTPHLVVTSFAPSATPPPPLPQLHIPPGRARNSLLIDIDPPSTSPR